MISKNRVFGQGLLSVSPFLGWWYGELFASGGFSIICELRFGFDTKGNTLYLGR